MAITNVGQITSGEAKRQDLAKRQQRPAPKTDASGRVSSPTKAVSSAVRGSSAPTGQVLGDQTTAQYGGGTGYSAGSAGATASSTQNIDLVNKLFDAKVSGLQGQLGVLGSQQDASEARIGNQYTTKWNDLQENLALGQRNLGESRNQVNESRARSLQDVRDRLQTQMMGYANQLGAMGAGDSSAVGQINTGLSAMASKNRGDVQENASNQLNTIDRQQESLVREFERNKRDLDSWRQETLSNLAMEIMQTKQKIKEAIAQADAQRAQQLADYDASYTQKAIEALGKLEALYSSNAKDLSAKYRNALAPQTIKIDPALQRYAVQKIDAGELRDLAMPEQANPEAEAIAIMRKREEDAQNALLQPTPIA